MTRRRVCLLDEQLVYLANDILFHAQRQRPDAGPTSWAADPVAVELRNALAVMVCATSAHANAQVKNSPVRRHIRTHTKQRESNAVYTVARSSMRRVGRRGRLHLNSV